MTRPGLIAASAILIGAAACSNKSEPMDSSLKADIQAAAGGNIELAPSAAKPQTIVSAIEGGPKSAPKRAAPKKRPVMSPRPTLQNAADEAPAPSPAPSPVQEQPAAPRPAPVQTAPAPQQDRRVYKTEEEIFRQMPWIRP